MAFVLVSNAHVVLISQRKHVTAVSKDALPTCFLFQPSCVYMKARVNEPGRFKWAESTHAFSVIPLKTLALAHMKAHETQDIVDGKPGKRR